MDGAAILLLEQVRRDAEQEQNNTEHTKEGFTTLYYQGKPVRIDPRIPKGKIVFEYEDGTFKLLDIETGEVEEMGEKHETT